MKKSPITSGTWAAHNGSELKLIISEDNTVSGTYNTGSGKPEISEHFPVTGYVNGDLIGFVVSWTRYNSITSWCGRFTLEEDGRECIKAMWYLGRMHKANNEETQMWETFLTNSTMLYKERKIETPTRRTLFNLLPTLPSWRNK